MYLFTYGTLKTGEVRNTILDGCKQILQTTGEGLFLTKEKFSLYDIHGSFPALVKRPAVQVSGEVYEINEEMLKYLDIVEGYPHLYYRSEIEVEGLDEKCTAYMMDRRIIIDMKACSVGINEVKSGVWNG